MKISREWATPLTLGTFALMAVTGVLMFFHLDTGLNKTAHEWLGWLMVVGVALHGVVNWPALRKHLHARGLPRLILVLSAVVLVASFLPKPGGQQAGSPPSMALRAVLAAPLSEVIPLTPFSPDQALATLAAAGYPQATMSTRLNDLAHHERAQEARLIRILFSQPSTTP